MKSQGEMSRGRVVGVVGLVALLAAVLVFSLSIKENLNTDENVFIASGALLRAGVLPYRDYHYNHMPSLVFVYSILFGPTDHLLLAARSFNALCATAAVVSLFCASWNWFRTIGRAGLVAACGIAVLFAVNPLFTYTAGQAWNHDFPLLCCLISVLVLMFGIARPRAILWMLLAGALLGLAVTSRLSYATAPLGFVVFVAVYPNITMRRRAALLSMLALGSILVSLPSAWVWFQSPRNAYFGNFLYPALNTRYHSEHVRSGHPAFSIGARLWYLIRTCVILPGNGVVTIGFIALLIKTFRPRAVRRDPRQSQLLCILTVVLCLTGSAFAASPMYRQYMYAVTPFMILGIARTLSMIADWQHRVVLKRSLGGGLAVAVVIGVFAYNGLLLLPFPSRWQPMKIHQVGVQIAELTGGGRVLTLEPVYALEGKLPIFNELATGRFQARAAQYLSRAELTQYKMLNPADVVALIQTDHPAGVLVSGADGELEAAMVRAAKAQGYQPTEIPEIGTLWCTHGNAPHGNAR